MKKLLRLLRLKRFEKKRKKSKEEQLYSRLVQNDLKCNELRFKIAKPNRNVRYRKDYTFNEVHLRKFVFLTLEQEQIKYQLYDTRK